MPDSKELKQGIVKGKKQNENKKNRDSYIMNTRERSIRKQALALSHKAHKVMYGKAMNHSKMHDKHIMETRNVKTLKMTMKTSKDTIKAYTINKKAKGEKGEREKLIELLIKAERKGIYQQLPLKKITKIRTKNSIQSVRNQTKRVKQHLGIKNV